MTEAGDVLLGRAELEEAFTALREAFLPYCRAPREAQRIHLQLSHLVFRRTRYARSPE
jgi:hypothetical protein